MRATGCRGFAQLGLTPSGGHRLCGFSSRGGELVFERYRADLTEGAVPPATVVDRVDPGTDSGDGFGPAARRSSPRRRGCRGPFPARCVARASTSVNRHESRGCNAGACLVPNGTRPRHLRCGSVTPLGVLTGDVDRWLHSASPLVEFWCGNGGSSYRPVPMVQNPSFELQLGRLPKQT